ncbi:MAG TPA: hypothetical protein VFY10_01750 [Dehalococcoidia bacterium]|nr:hypothetical protein [Dehalococcoidia bacterium]
MSIEVEPEYADELNRWQKEEGVPRLLQSPGYRSAVRCEAVVGAPRYASIFEVDSAEATKFPIDQTSSFLPATGPLSEHVQIDVAVYEQIFPDEGVLRGVSWQDEGKTPGAILLNRFNVVPEFEEEFNAWYNTEHLPMMADVDGTISDRRFAATMAKQKYLARYDLMNPDVPTTEAWLKVRYTPWTKWIGRAIRDGWRCVLVPIEDYQFPK